MHRVLSFQVGQGLGETNEFITKRTCCSFLFSVGFLCLLGGFLLGQFASEKALQIKEQKFKKDLSNNGLDASKELRKLLLDYLNNTNFFTGHNGELYVSYTFFFSCFLVLLVIIWTHYFSKEKI